MAANRFVESANKRAVSYCDGIKYRSFSHTVRSDQNSHLGVEIDIERFEAAIIVQS